MVMCVLEKGGNPMKILEELWYGNVDPRQVENTSGRHKNLTRLVTENEKKLLTLLSDEAKEIYEKLADCQKELNDLEQCEMFIRGFKLGARIMIEVTEGMDVPSVDD